MDGDDPTPPPYYIWILTCLPLSAPPGLEGALMPKPGPGEVPAAATTLPPALLEFTELPFCQALIPAMETSGQWPQNSTSAVPSRLYPSLPICTPPRNRGKEPHYRCPSESYNSLQFRTHGGVPSAPCSLVLPAIFLYGYIKLAETCSTVLRAAQAMIRLMETIFRTHRST